MSAAPVYDADDPAQILQLLPAHWHEQFLAEYRADLDAAREVGNWQQLRTLLHRWHLRAVAYSDPQFEMSAQAVRDAQPSDLAPLPGWEPAR